MTSFTRGLALALVLLFGTIGSTELSPPLVALELVAAFGGAMYGYQKAGSVDGARSGALWAGGGLLALVGLFVLAGPVAVPVVVVLGLVGTTALVVRRLGPADEPAAPAPEAGSRGTPPLETVSDTELCRRWRRSCAILARPCSAAQLHEVAELRHRYLSELERRHPEGFRRWLDCGPRAAGDPTPFLSDRRPTEHGQ